jgi:CheY-like chemotaxis protein
MPLNSILLIDDDEITNFFNRHLIEKMGIARHVHVENNGQYALRYLTEKEAYAPDYQKPDLILLDINMPIMNGFEFLQEYESLSVDSHSRHLIVMLTTSILDADRNKALRFSSLTDCYSKPLNEEQLQEIMEKYFN